MLGFGWCSGWFAEFSWGVVFGARETLLLAGLLAGTLTLLTIATIPRLRDPEHNPQESSANRPEHQPNPRNDAPTTSRADENP